MQNGTASIGRYAMLGGETYIVGYAYTDPPESY